MAVTYRRSSRDPKSNTYVARITLCKGVPVYGFHVGWRFYLKIYMLNPMYMQRLAELLRNSSIMGRPMQPYEVHIPYLLQFMADYGLYGCGWVECQTVTFRAPVPIDNDGKESEGWNASTIPGHLITSSADKPRLSHCSIEIDLLSHHILNRRTISPRLLHHDFIERHNPVPLDQKLVHSMAELWRDEERRRAKNGDPQSEPFMYTSGSRHDEGDRGNGPWIHEAEMRVKINETIQAERERSDTDALSFDTFVSPTNFQSIVQTALESVTDMFPSELPSSSQKENYVGMNVSSWHLRENSGEFPSAQIDEGRIFELLDEIEATAGASQSIKEEDYFSERSSKSPSGIDFDADLLGRGQQETIEPPIDYERMPPFADRQFNLSAGEDFPEFSDDLEIDFDFTSLAGKTQNSPRASETAHPVTTVNHGNDTNNNNEVEVIPPFRLRGGASTPELKKRKRSTDSISSAIRQKLKFVENVDGQFTNDIPFHRQAGLSHSNSSTGGVNEMVNPSVVESRPHLVVDDRSVNKTSLGESSARFRQGPELKSHYNARNRPNQGQLATLDLSHPHFEQYVWQIRPPSTPSLLSSLHGLGIPRVIPRSAYYSKDDDVSASTREYGGREFKLVSNSLQYVKSFNSGANFSKTIFKDTDDSTPRASTRIWQIQQVPPLKVTCVNDDTVEDAVSTSGFQARNLHP